MMRIRRCANSETFSRYRFVSFIVYAWPAPQQQLARKAFRLVPSRAFVPRLGFGSIYHSAGKAKPLMIGFPARIETVDAFLGAKRRSPPVVADQPELPAAYGTALH